MNARLLIVEDERAIQIALVGLFKKHHTVTVAGSGAEAIALLGKDDFDLVLTDLALGEGATGMDVLHAALDAKPGTPVVVITAHGNEKVAVAAMKAGAADYIPKPFDNDELRLVVDCCLARTRLERDHRLLLERVERERGLGKMVGTSPAMRQIFATIHKVAPTDLTVLIRGESGTGKELAAQALHGASARAKRPFVAVNCAAMSRDLVESELFGHEKGSFTGADARRIGRFELASGGTLFLDEIGDMPKETQAKVLRVLQERSFERVGGTTPIATDARVVAATHRDLEADVREGRFREDLYYRLRVIDPTMPPLRVRREDIAPLALQLLAQACDRLGLRPKILGAAALASLSAHSWPGNVRELKNVLEKAAVLGEDEIEAADLALEPALTARSASSQELPNLAFSDAKRRIILDFERRFLSEALARHDGNVSRTADAIGMVRQSLQQKIREHRLRGAKE